MRNQEEKVRAKEEELELTRRAHQRAAASEAAAFGEVIKAKRHPREVAASEAKRRFAKTIRDAEGVDIVLTKYGEARIVMVAYERWKELLKKAEGGEGE